MDTPIYLDNHATTAVDPRVFDVMAPFFTEVYGNAASRTHSFGWEAEAAVDRAREQVATGIGATAKEIVFTSGATEAINLALKGAAHARRERGDHIITVQTEHKAGLDTCTALERVGFMVTRLPVDSDGLITVAQVLESMTDSTILVSVMAANNEVGVLQPIAEIGAICRERDVLFHTDAAQAVGKIPLNVHSMCIDLLSISGHKVYGPKGIGALYVRRARPLLKLQPQIHGGGHERGMRSGTLPVPLIVGLGEAVALAVVDLDSEAARTVALRDRLWEGLQARLTEIHLNGHPTLRLPGNLNVSFGYVEGDALLTALADIAVSSGSACTSASLEPSYVLKAMGVSDRLSYGSVRFGIGRFNTSEQIDHVVKRVSALVSRLRELSPLWAAVVAGEAQPSDWTEVRSR